MPAIDPPSPGRRVPRVFDDAALERLDDLIETELCPQGGMPLEGVDGLFCAARVSPGTPIELREVLPFILGKALDSVSEEVRGLLELMWAAVARRIARMPQDADIQSQPLVEIPLSLLDPDSGMSDEERDAVPIGAAWAMGFLLGYSLRQEAWQARLEADEDSAEDFECIVSLSSPWLDPRPASDDDDEDWEDALDEPDAATALRPDAGGDGDDGLDLGDDADDEIDDGDDAWLGLDDDDDDEEAWIGPDDAFEDNDGPPSFEDRLSVICDLPWMLHQWHRLAIEERTPRTPVRSERLPGRNDPCPCGSGLKFKKCHGDPARLH